MGRTFLLAHGLVLIVSHVASAADEVRLSEVHYHPQAPDEKEFIELHNAGTSPVDLLGWSFSDGVRYSFVRSTVLAPGAYLAITADDFEGRLDDSGERIAIADVSGRLVEELTYGDAFPFDPAADGGGASLTRLCFDAPASAPFNWRAEAPTPGAPRAGAAVCPPVPPPTDPEAFPVVINEIHYHPRGTLEPPLEFVEILNRSSAARDVSGWALDKGVHFTFPAGTTIPAGGYAVVAQDPDALAAQQGIERARLLGPFADDTNLSNSGERLRLVNALEQVQDEVEYADDGPWSSLADGLGSSLQRVDPLGPSNAPGNWRAARPPAPGAGGDWREFRIEGPHEGTRIYFYLADAGEVLIDAVSLEVKDVPGVNALPDGDFTAGLGAWAGIGNHAGTVAEASGGFGDGGPCAHVKATGPGNGGQNGVRVTLSAVPPKGARCILTLRVKPVSGESRFTARSSSATVANGLIYLQADARTGDDGAAPTPLAPNSASETSTPPTIEGIETEPSWPTSRDAVLLHARVISAAPADVVASYQVGTGDTVEVALRDDGVSPDARASDGTFSGTIPPAPDGSLVWVSVRATAGGAVSYFPPWRNPSPVTGYLVEDDLPAQNEDLRLYYIFTPGALADLSCNDGAYTRGDFVDFHGRAHRAVGVKFRGETACSYPKRPMRVEFQKGDLFDRQQHLNFNACWNDKSIIREQMAFDFFRDAGCGYSETHLARVHTKAGAFHGAYFTIEDPDEQYLKRNRLRPDGGFYKCRTAMLSGGTGGYEPRTDASQAKLTAVNSFATDLNRLSGQALIDFLIANLDVESVINYQAVQDIIIDGDSVVKNWLLYYGRQELAGPGQDLFTMLGWDCDLTYGQMLLTTDVRNYDIHPLFQTATYPFYDQGYHGILTALLQKAPGDFFVKAFYGRSGIL